MKKLVLAVIIIFLIIIPLSENPYLNLIILKIIISCIMAIGLDICTGVSGQVSLGQAGFMAIGGYICAKLIIINNSFTFIIIAIIISSLISALLAYFIGSFILRLQSDYLSIATMALGEIIILYFELSKHFGKARGLYNIPKFNNIYLAYIIFIIALFFSIWFIKSKTGFLCFAIGQDEIASKSIGIKTLSFKISSFIIGAIICSVAGALYSGTIGFISPSDFDFGKSIDCLAAVVLGGPRTIIGPIIAAVIIELTTILLQPIAAYRMIIYGVLLIVFAHKRYYKKG
ncbi:MAG: branched-chain amino acid ABC transporter permease [Oscillospiraceae bacterium]